MSKRPAIGSRHQETDEVLSSVSAHRVMRKALFEGRVEYRSYFMMRMRDRDFSALDFENVVRFGTINSPGEHSVTFNNWRYRVSKRIEDFTLEIVVAIDCSEDVDALPLIIPVTGFWTGKGTGNGKRATQAEQRGDRGKAAKAVRSG